MHVSDEKPQGRKGLCPWGLTHRHKFEPVQVDNRTLYAVSTVYMKRMKLPKYIKALIESRSVTSGTVEQWLTGLRARMANYKGNAAVKIKMADVIYLGDPEITIQVEIIDSTYNKLHIRSLLITVMEWINQFLDMFRDILVTKIVESNEKKFRQYVISKNGSIRYSRRP